MRFSSPKHFIVVALGLGLFFLAPYIILLSQFSLSHQINLNELYLVIKNTFVLALGSAFCSLFFGVLGGMGLLWWASCSQGSKFFFWVEKSFLIPSIMPSFFVIISVLSVFSAFTWSFPFGKSGVILIQTLINVGLVSVMFKHVAEQKLGALGSLCLIERASRWQFFRVGVLGYLFSDLLSLFIYVFVSSMVSFNVPVIAGGFTGKTLEVLIFEKLMIDQDWSLAITLSFIQMGLLIVLTLFQKWTASELNSKVQNQLLELIEFKWGLLIPL